MGCPRKLGLRLSSLHRRLVQTNRLVLAILATCTEANSIPLAW
ncbi:MAG: hypothetical protein OJF50_002776 [Nitrospira sp.]|nr:hypothetical protein [Nitrospira sp.]